MQSEAEDALDTWWETRERRWWLNPELAHLGAIHVAARYWRRCCGMLVDRGRITKKHHENRLTMLSPTVCFVDEEVAENYLFW